MCSDLRTLISLAQCTCSSPAGARKGKTYILLASARLVRHLDAQQGPSVLSDEQICVNGREPHRQHLCVGLCEEVLGDLQKK